MKLKYIPYAERQFIIEFDENELNTIYVGMTHNIKRENRPSSVTEENILKGIDKILNVTTNQRDTGQADP